jgi:hypothetical protein
MPDKGIERSVFSKSHTANPANVAALFLAGGRFPELEIRELAKLEGPLAVSECRET